MVGAGIADNAVPDDGRVGGVVGAGPVGGNVDKEVLCVPGEEAREVCLEREANHGIFFLFRAVVMRTAFDTVCPKAMRVSRCAMSVERRGGEKMLTLEGYRA